MGITLVLLFVCISAFMNAWQLARKCTHWWAFWKCVATCSALALPFVCICVFLSARQPVMKNSRFAMHFKSVQQSMSCQCYHLGCILIYTFPNAQHLAKKTRALSCVSKTNGIAFVLPFIYICNPQENAQRACITIHLHLSISEWNAWQLTRKCTPCHAFQKCASFVHILTFAQQTENVCFSVRLENKTAMCSALALPFVCIYVFPNAQEAARKCMLCHVFCITLELPFRLHLHLPISKQVTTCTENLCFAVRFERHVAMHVVLGLPFVCCI